MGLEYRDGTGKSYSILSKFIMHRYYSHTSKRVMKYFIQKQIEINWQIKKSTTCCLFNDCLFNNRSKSSRYKQNKY